MVPRESSTSSWSLTQLTSAGGEVTLGAGYRINPNFMIGLYGSGAMYGTRALTSGANIWSATAGVQANYHFLPESEWHPWIGLGSGWRGHWINASGTDSRHGWDIARLTAGLDYRLSSVFAVSPYAGLGATRFLKQELAAEQSFSNINTREELQAWDGVPPG